MMQIPDGVNVLAAYKRNSKTFENQIFEFAEDDKKYRAQLTAAELPAPDAKASQIERIFSDTFGGEISIDNGTFGMIEKNDSVYIVYEEFDNHTEPAALIITNGYGENENIVGIIFDTEYYNENSEG